MAAALALGLLLRSTWPALAAERGVAVLVVVALGTAEAGLGAALDRSPHMRSNLVYEEEARWRNRGVARY